MAYCLFIASGNAFACTRSECKRGKSCKTPDIITDAVNVMEPDLGILIKMIAQCGKRFTNEVNRIVNKEINGVK
jgi:hypothetical protein